jgi:DnaJ-class molecular chaperone
MPSFPQYYQILGLDKNATTEEIRAAYRRESLRWRLCLCTRGILDEISVELIQIVFLMPLLRRRRYDCRIYMAIPLLMLLQAATAQFQLVADSYYVLADSTRRREYDALLASRAYKDRSTSADASDNFFSNFANMFQGASAASGSSHAESKDEQEEPFERPDAEATFGNVFEEVRS